MLIAGVLPTWRAILNVVLSIFLLIGLAATTLSSHAQSGAALQPIPALSGHVIDTTDTLGPADRQALEAKLAAFEQSRGAQIVLLMVSTTQPEDITSYTQRLGDAWKIGRKGVGDGLLLVVAKNDRKVRIATAKALEGAVPDLAASQVIDTALSPRFKQGDFAGGLSAAADQLMALIAGENLPAPVPQGADRKAGGLGGFEWTDLAVFLFFAVPIGAKIISSVVGRKLGALATGGIVGALAWFFTSSMLLAGAAGVMAVLFALFASLGTLGALSGRGRSSGWGSSGGGFGGGGGGGGFSSGGGGNFGGGGASGGW